MQKRRSFLFLLLLSGKIISASSAISLPPDVFYDDLSKLDCEMVHLSQLEQLVEESNATQSQLIKEENPLSRYLLQTGDLAASLLGGSAPEEGALLGIPGFLWGFCCSVFGTLLVYVSIDDPLVQKKEGRQALIGCAIGTLLWGGLYILLILSLSFYG